MQLTDIRIHEIVDVDGLPAYARSTARFGNGPACEFHANFAHGYGADSAIVLRATDQRRQLTQRSRAAKAIQDRLGFPGIESRERDAIASFEQERVAACRKLMASPAS